MNKNSGKKSVGINKRFTSEGVSLFYLPRWESHAGSSPDVSSIPTGFCFLRCF